MANAGEGPAGETTRPESRARAVVVDGDRGKVIDMQGCRSVPEATALMGLESGWSALLLANYRSRLDDMDRQGIDVEALSINPYWYRADRDLAGEVVRIQNEKLAEFCATQPERFVGLASVALQHPDLAADQLEDPSGVTTCAAR